MPNLSIQRQRATTFVGVGAPAVAPRLRARGGASGDVACGFVETLPLSHHAERSRPAPRSFADARSSALRRDRVWPTRPTPQSTGSVSTFAFYLRAVSAATAQLLVSADFRNPGFGSRFGGAAAKVTAGEVGTRVWEAGEEPRGRGPTRYRQRRVDCFGCCLGSC